MSCFLRIGSLGNETKPYESAVDSFGPKYPDGTFGPKRETILNDFSGVL